MTSTGLVSRIAYNSVYGVLCLVLTVLLLIVPGDFIQQALINHLQIINLIVIAIVYVITILIVLFVYFLRLYVTRTVLASIPKPWIPIEKGDVKKEVHNTIAKSQSRSAAIAWEARPRVITPPHTPEEPVGSLAEDKHAGHAQAKEIRASLQLFRSKQPRPTVEDEMVISLPPLRPVWGEVEHYGWGSPASLDLANLQYTTVLAELPNLIEAKAVSQAPPDPDSAPTAPVLDAEAVMLLQRAPNMTMRSYIAHLTSLGVLRGSQYLVRFLDLYERARFSGRPMSNATFRSLMHLFAELLRAMQPLNPSILYDDDSSIGHIDDDAPQDSNPTTRTPSPSLKSTRSIRSFERDRNSVHARPRNSSAATRGQYRTAPTTPRSRAEATFTSRSPSSASSGSSFTESRRLYPASQTSSVSLGSGSVIRLATVSDTGDLPYVLRLADTI
ncbi:hypothetical protein E0Z10_g7875 [Xylaria hypoxylon]|uniref:Defect at low temperature protein 1 n=1 Tax=Xylaria hypoxylon TaxID=37992 RepID=A0A4Z0YWT8_9PEZI|nr:hypothetical protein E0Z10_g7875 [Xylaria hypoxylon]